MEPGGGYGGGVGGGGGGGGHWGRGMKREERNVELDRGIGRITVFARCCGSIIREL